MKSKQSDVKDRIYSEAIRLFGEKGFEGTPIQAVADAVGIRKPSLLYHFNSKEELGDEVLKLMITSWKEKLPELLKDPSNAYKVFEKVIEELVAFFSEDPNRARLVMREAMDRPERVSSLAREHLKPWMDELQEYIRAGQQFGVIRQNVDPIAYITEVVMMVLATVAIGDVARVIFGTPADDSATREIVRMARTSLFID